jgi:DNA-binding PadR family transcriptional regulator
MGYLGEFEQLLILAMLKLDRTATAAAIRALVEEAAGRKVWIGAVHTTLDRLEAKGLVKSAIVEQPEGRRKTFAPTAAGAHAIQRVHETWMRLSDGLVRIK